jgi:hypothetical protein
LPRDGLIFTLTCLMILASQACSSTGATAIPPADFEILFIGNSHSSRNDLPETVALLLESALPEQSAYATAAPRWAFLAERIDDGVTQKSLDSRNWTHVVLQAQKYSSSGRYFYPVDAALEWIRRVRAQEATPVLFPEWPRRGNSEEGQRVFDLHRQIAAIEPACVAPIGQAWDMAADRYPKLRLYAGDGNHANRAGTLLTAYVFFELISGSQASLLPDIPGLNVDSTTQEQLRSVASTAMLIYPVPEWCRGAPKSNATKHN